jgi:hypothetical protein
MALKDVIKKGSGAPAPADLIVGGIGVDTLNKRLYFKADDGTVVPHDNNTPAGNIAATTVQGAINELDTEKASKGANADITSLSALSSINGGQLAGLRNRIINGDMRVAQRAATAIVANTFTYGGADRILWSINGTITAGTISQIGGGSAGISGYSSALAMFSGSGISSAYTQTRIEAKDSINLNSKTITVSCKVFQDTGAAVNVTPYIAKPPTTADTFTNNPTTIASGTAVTVPSGVLTTITATYILGAAAASLGIAPSLTWAISGTYTSKYLTVTDWQLEIGTVATPFEQRPYGMELALCQRYYWQQTNVIFTTGVYRAGTTNLENNKKMLPVPMRIAPPTCSATSPTGAVYTNGSSAALASVSSFVADDNTQLSLVAVTAASVQGLPGWLNVTSTLTASAEL